jgi:hypothetical protein
MNRKLRDALIFIVVVGLILWIPDFASQRLAVRQATQNGKLRDFHNVTTEELDQKIREQISLGSSRDFVEGYLTAAGMEFNVDHEINAIYAGARNLKGSGFLITKSVGFTFKFDDALLLRSIDKNVSLTGP